MTAKHLDELFFLCEDLLSYTDLTGSRFDPENALRRLLPMKSLLEASKNDDWMNRYQLLESQLESIHFDFEEFAKGIRALFDEISEKRAKK